MARICTARIIGQAMAGLAGPEITPLIKVFIPSIKTKKSTSSSIALPHCPLHDFDVLIDLFSSSLGTIQNLILLGDFNVNFSADSSLKHKLSILTDNLSLS